MLELAKINICLPSKKEKENLSVLPFPDVVSLMNDVTCWQ